ncbi:MAG: LL-diaminopimelate aminotransferase [Actinomycetota bacterium]
MDIIESDRLKSLPPYLFAEIDEIIKEKKQKGQDVISLGIGDPDIPTPDIIIEALHKSAQNPENHRYPSSYGMPEFREAVIRFYKNRFKVNLTEDEVIPLWGSKEGIANIAYTFVNPGDYVIVPNPSYLVYKIGTMFAGGNSFEVPLVEENNFLMDLSIVDKNISKKTKLMYINYPNNPTSAACGVDFYKDVVEFAEKNNIIVCHDNAYSDIYSDKGKKPVSFLNEKGAKDVGVEFNSLSKTFNMTGWRIAYAVGNREIIQSLGKYKTNVDSGVFNAVQYAAVKALDNYGELVTQNNKVYNKRRKMVKETLDEIGIDYYDSEYTIYVWSKVPSGFTSKSFAKMLLDEANVVVTPGSAFGSEGEGYFRISLTISNNRLEEALRRIEKAI